MIGVLIQNLIKTFGAKPADFHILGHSLGSHVAGFAGKFLNGTLGHITGLDPAGPNFEGIRKEGRLWHTDAQFVEAIHTDAVPLLTKLGFGMYETCAHLDFYPNGGKTQPGCNQERFTSIFVHGISEEVRRLVACNHQRSIDFYMDTLRDSIPAQGIHCADYDSYLAGKCADCGSEGTECALMGPDVDLWRSAIKGQLEASNGKRYFLKTDTKAPYFSEFFFRSKVGVFDGTNSGVSCL